MTIHGPIVSSPTPLHSLSSYNPPPYLSTFTHMGRPPHAHTGRPPHSRRNYKKPERDLRVYTSLSALARARNWNSQADGEQIVKTEPESKLASPEAKDRVEPTMEVRVADEKGNTKRISPMRLLAANGSLLDATNVPGSETRILDHGYCHRGLTEYGKILYHHSSS